MLNNSRVQVFNALQAAGAITNSKALSAKELKVEGLDPDTVSTVLSSLYNRSQNIVGRVQVYDENSGTKFKYFTKREKLPMSGGGGTRIKLQRRHSNGSAPVISAPRDPYKVRIKHPARLLIAIGENKTEAMTIEEARDLYEQLRALFGGRNG